MRHRHSATIFENAFLPSSYPRMEVSGATDGPVTQIPPQGSFRPRPRAAFMPFPDHRCRRAGLALYVLG